MLNATTKAKELAVNELKAHILNKDEQQKIIQNLHKRVEELETLNQELVVVNKDLITAKGMSLFYAKNFYISFSKYNFTSTLPLYMQTLFIEIFLY